eukprot:305005-Rhodomonas_salina.3
MRCPGLKQRALVPGCGSTWSTQRSGAGAGSAGGGCRENGGEEQAWARQLTVEAGGDAGLDDAWTVCSELA